jgi:hypothetical protein
MTFRKESVILNKKFSLCRYTVFRVSRCKKFVLWMGVVLSQTTVTQTVH